MAHYGIFGGFYGLARDGVFAYGLTFFDNSKKCAAFADSLWIRCPV